jgi:serine/threonine protein kinase
VQTLLNLTAASSNEIRRLAWNNLLPILIQEDAMDLESSVLAEIFKSIQTAVRASVERDSFDFGGIPFELLLNAKSEKIRLSAVSMFAKLIQEDKKWRKHLTQALGKSFLSTYIQCIVDGLYDPTEILVEPSELELGKMIGHGASGTVYKSSWKGKAVAVKTISEEAISFSMKEFLSEMALMNIVRHPNVAHLLCGSVEAGNYFLVLKFYPRGALDDLLAKKAAEFSEPLKDSIILQVARAMKYLHSLSVVHRDLKPGNILVDEDWSVAVCDFGASRCVDTLNMTRGVGTPLYCAPEVLEGTQYNASADIYSFGICVWQILNEIEPYKGINYMQLVPRIVEGLRPPVDKDNAYYEILTTSWTENAALRPSFSEIVAKLKRLRGEDKQVVKKEISGGKMRQRSETTPVPQTMAKSSGLMEPANDSKRLSMPRRSESALIKAKRSPRGSGGKSGGEGGLRVSHNEIEFK